MIWTRVCVGYYPTSAVIIANCSLTLAKPKSQGYRLIWSVRHDGLGITHDAKTVNHDAPYRHLLHYATDVRIFSIFPARRKWVTYGMWNVNRRRLRKLASGGGAIVIFGIRIENVQKSVYPTVRKLKDWLGFGGFNKIPRYSRLAPRQVYPLRLRNTIHTSSTNHSSSI